MVHLTHLQDVRSCCSLTVTTLCAGHVFLKPATYPDARASVNKILKLAETLQLGVKDLPHKLRSMVQDLLASTAEDKKEKTTKGEGCQA
jgi:hypothetical protein